ncbi:hypothetical protein IE81DRAFT_22234 [Ceraceosorus guamensis]|uniref:Xylanolytic transcriptional activator regulatory domain-containing protein n=1 Tax=Ceraceosorus guamensis TaxID=1522189 RepID=A0A316VPP1_9BASI|nr:hypothetical protein IE81DRAFT_22234 [Ceraceosorus guamensis]PWN39546.1 hypothetical protein IE81DRAFT_22234 [Ceraceosorus guamensis]
MVREPSARLGLLPAIACSRSARYTRSRKRKSKCDRNAPCSSCVLRGTEYLCYTCDELPEGATTAGRSKGTSRPSAAQRAISNVWPAGSLGTQNHEYDSAGIGAVYGGAKRKRESSSALSPRTDAQRCHAASAEPRGPTSMPSGSPQQSEAILAGRLQAQELLNAQLKSEVATLRQLECERRVLFEADAISHRDIAHLLPGPLETMTVCAKVIYRHMWSTPGIHWRSFQTTLEALVLYDKPVSPLFVACLFATISMSRYLPSSQGVQADLLPRQYPQYADLAGQILDRRLGSVTTSADNLFQRLQVETILVMYHCVHSERSDIASAYFRLGNALRCASALRLFNETKWLRPVSPFKTEMYRRAAWQLFAWDRLLRPRVCSSPATTLRHQRRVFQGVPSRIPARRSLRRPHRCCAPCSATRRGFQRHCKRVRA